MSLTRVLHIGKYSSAAHGGIETFTHQLLCELQRCPDYICGLVVNSSQKEFSFSLHHTHEPYPLWEIPTHMLPAQVPVSGHAYRALRQIAAVFSPDIVHVHMPSVLGLIAPLAFPHAKKIIHWHADVAGTQVQTQFPRLFSIYSRVEQYLLKKADKIIATSPYYAATSCSLHGHQQKVSIIPLGIANRKCVPPCSMNAAELPTDYVLALGRLAPYKGFEYAIQAINLLENSGLHLIIAGDGSEWNSLQQMIERTHCSERIHLVGRVSEEQKHALLQHAIALVLPSLDRAEAFGMVLLEAMQYAKPLITSDVPGSGMNYVNLHGRTGIVVPPADASALAQAFSTLWSEPETRIQYGKSGEKRFQEHFTLPVVAQRVYQLYEAVKP